MLISLISCLPMSGSTHQGYCLDDTSFLSQHFLIEKALSRLRYSETLHTTYIVGVEQQRDMITNALKKHHIHAKGIFLFPNDCHLVTMLLHVFAYLSSLGNALCTYIPISHIFSDEDAWHHAVKKAREHATQDKMILIGGQPQDPYTPHPIIITDMASNSSDDIFPVHELVMHPTTEIMNEQSSHTHSYEFTESFIGYSSIIFQLLCSAVAIDPSSIYSPSQKKYNEYYFKHTVSLTEHQDVDTILYNFFVHSAMINIETFWINMFNWESLYKLSCKDNNQNYTNGNVSLLDCSGCFIQSSVEKLVMKDIHNHIIIAEPDRIFIKQRKAANNQRNSIKNRENYAWL